MTRAENVPVDQFDHRDLGTSESAWRADGRLGELPVLSRPGPSDHVVVVAAHPDDESLGAGGLIHQASRCGARVTVVVATDGEGSHPESPTHARSELATLRRREVLDAVGALDAAATVHPLGLPDGGLAAFEPALAAALTELASDATLVVTPWAGDRHPDHEAAATAGAELAERLGVPHWGYPVWMWHWGSPADAAVPWEKLRGLPLSAADLAAKARAVSAHRTQTAPLSAGEGDEAVLAGATIEHFLRRVEVYAVAGRTGPSGTRPAYFDALYREESDPWGLGSRFYEQRKRETLLAALPRARFRRVFEPGCATGLITEHLAARCDEVVAWDVAAAAVEQTTTRLREAGREHGTSVTRGRIPEQWPDGVFDLVVLSEVGYYCASLPGLVASVLASLAPDGVVVGCHWRHPAREHVHSGDAVHEAFGRHLLTSVAHVEEDFILHVWGRDPRALQSVARREGLV
ncbi:PIG-L family deacetylase [Jatrophihabitans sp. YIM 134969]